MVEPDRPGEQQPLLQPRLIRFLKNRPKLLGGGIRESFLEELEKNIIERRTPEKVADKAARAGAGRAQEAALPVVRDKAKNRMAKANEKALRRL